MLLEASSTGFKCFLFKVPAKEPASTADRESFFFSKFGRCSVNLFRVKSNLLPPTLVKVRILT
jgi:hypothetical protein